MFLPITSILIGLLLIIQPDYTADSLFYFFVRPFGVVSFVAGIYLGIINWREWNSKRFKILGRGRMAIKYRDEVELERAIDELGEIASFSSQKHLVLLAAKLSKK